MKLTLAQVRRTALSFAFLFLAVWIGFYLGQNQALIQDKKSELRLNRQVPVDHQEAGFELFWDVWDRLENSFLEKNQINPVKMVYGAISGLVSSLGDPYTVFLPPDDNQRAQEDLAGSFGGIGIQLGFINGHLGVIAPLSNTPAERAGIRAGDLILAIDGQATGEITLPQAVDLIRGETGTKVTLSLLHQDQDSPYEVEIIRDTILVQSVEVKFLDNWCSAGSACPLIAHLKLIRFGDRTNDEWQKGTEEIVNQCLLSDQKCRGVILDLRNNPGGYLAGSVFIASEFLDSGTVVQQETADHNRQAFSVNRQGQLTELPLVALVNKGSASASEIVAGALKEHERAKIVGETTFGKGTIQEAQDLGGGAGLHITTARWLLPSGQSIDQKGLTPDFEVANDPERPEEDSQLKKAIEILE